jgi:hypothetical protein
MFDAKQEYIDHARYNFTEHGIVMPEWDDLEDYDKAEWEKWANAKNIERDDLNSASV